MRTKKILGLASIMVSALVAVGAGCANTVTNTVDTNTVTVDKTDTTTTDTVVDDEATVATPTISITEPVDGDTVETSFDVAVEIENFTLAPDKVEGANAEGEGHYHVWVDGEYVSPGVAETTTLADIAAGEHEVMVSLQNNDHTDLATPVKSAPVTVTVE